MSWNKFKRTCKPQRTKKSILTTLSIIILPMILGAYFFGLFPTTYDLKQDDLTNMVNNNQNKFNENIASRVKILEDENASKSLIDKIKEEEEHFEKGMIAFDNKDYVESLKEFYTVLDLNEDNIWAKANIGAILANIGQEKEAIPIFLEQLEKRPNNYGLIEANLGSVYLSSGDNVNAIKYLQKALTHSEYENNIDLFNDLGLALKNTGNYTGAKYYFESAIKIANVNHKIYFNYGDTLNELGFHQAALDAEIEALSQKPDYYNAKILKGSSLEYLGFFDQALTEYEEAIQIDDESSVAFKMKIRVEEKIKKYGHEDQQIRNSVSELVLFKENEISRDDAYCFPPNLILTIDPNQFKFPLELISISKYDDATRILEVNNHSNEPGVIMVNVECLKPLE